MCSKTSSGCTLSVLTLHVLADGLFVQVIYAAAARSQSLLELINEIASVLEIVSVLPEQTFALVHWHHLSCTDADASACVQCVSLPFMLSVTNAAIGKGVILCTKAACSAGHKHMSSIPVSLTR